MKLGAPIQPRGQLPSELPSTSDHGRDGDELFREANGQRRVKTLRREHIEKMIAAITNIYARRDWLKAIRPLLQSAVPTMIAVNPAEAVKQCQAPQDEGPPHVDRRRIPQYRNYWKLGTQQRLVLEFALQTASRPCESAARSPACEGRPASGSSGPRAARTSISC
jgi:hypothetical protein